MLAFPWAQFQQLCRRRCVVQIDFQLLRMQAINENMQLKFTSHTEVDQKPGVSDQPS